MDPVHKGLIIFGATFAGAIIVDLARENVRLRKDQERILCFAKATSKIYDALEETLTPEQNRIIAKVGKPEMDFIKQVFGDSYA